MADLDELRVFVLAVDHGGFAPAGKALGVPASTVSRAIDRLERRLEVALLHRSTRGVRPTELGKVYHEGARKLFAELDALEERVRGLAGGVSGQLRVTLPSMQDTPPLLEKCIADFSARHPELRVDSFATNRRVDLVAEGFDVALRGGPVEDAGLRARRLFGVEWWLVASADYCASHPAITRPEDLRAHRCLAYGSAEGAVRWPLRDGGSVEIEPALCSNNFGLLVRSVVSGAGVAFLPRELFRGPRAEGRVVELAPELVGRSEHFYVVYPAARPLPSKVRAFVDFAVEFFAAYALG